MITAIDNIFGIFVGYIANVLFYKIFGIPFIVLVLLVGAITFSFYFRFINIRGFLHSIDIIKGKYDNPDDTGQISHFQALTSALSATIGLGNIAGVAVAVSLGGPGAVFWMMFIAIFSMTAKFVSATLAQLYRTVHDDGSVSGGPMYYLDQGLKEMGLGTFGKVLGVLYAIFIIGGAFGGGNMFQANQSYELVGSLTGIPSWIYGIVLMGLVAAVIMGGIERIGKTTEKIVPTMVILYVSASLFIILMNLDKLPGVINSIFSQALNPEATYGGFMGVIVIGIKRAVFSNEGGVGSASIAHSAAKTDEPVREGIVAMIGPFIDTIVICFMTASVILITADQNPLINAEGIKGAELTSAAFGSAISWFPYILAIVVFLFSYSTMISWYYYGEKGWKYLSSADSSLIIYKAIFLCCVFIGSISSLSNVIDFSDMMILSCAVPNIIGAFFLLPKLKTHLNDYWSRYQEGKFQTFK
ncbi:MAG TPA: alanine/glycine:cation symporter family protein [Candidatus Marinimicrobia bacterium]|jgi:AGCS family alanine or glycine:cation symporter|nr:alanine/glycine:cation symporter family protein [Candidatus Neomarinimicrobiota bacterium]HJM84053.1 alanine/glycine:cation symporter family protein [Candidatus Neomarinimicrobiota bacterium]